MDSSRLSRRTVTTVFFVLVGFIAFSQSQTDFIYKFNNETATMHDNALVSDGSFLYDVSYDGGINGGGSLFKVNPDGSGYSILYNFYNASTGMNPVGTLTLSGTTLYGMTIFGGDNNFGIIYKIETNGTGFQKLLDFNGTNGALPYCSLILNGSTIYGISQQGGSKGQGLVFKLQTDGTGYQSLLNFDGANGWAPVGSLTLSGSMLYGTTVRGGANDLGVVYALSTDGAQFKKLVDFEQSTGAIPAGSLTLSGTTLFGTTSQGGDDWMGTLFKVQTNGTNYEVIHYFGAEGNHPTGKLIVNDETIFGMTANGGIGAGVIFRVDTIGENYTNIHAFDKINGRDPAGSLTLAGDKLYGHVAGGANDYGVIFSVTPDGTEFRNLKNFTATNKGYEPRGALALTATSGFGVTNRGGAYNKGVIYKTANNGLAYEVLHDFNGDDGAFPESSMTLSGTTLYGTTILGGSGDQGTVFKIDTTGLNFKVLVNFNGNNGTSPVGALVDDGVNTMYGMTSSNATNYKGTVFKFDYTTNTLTTLYSFGDTDAIRPYGAIALEDSKLYGMSLGGVGDGVVFSLNLDGSGFTKVLDRSSLEAGRYPNALTVSNSTIYGTMTQGGETDFGTVFKVNIDGTGFLKLVDFVYGNGGESNGAIPTGATIVVGDSILYGMTKIGGPHDSGVAYSVRTDGSDFRILVNFDEIGSLPSGRTNSAGIPLRVDGSLAFKNEYFYAPLSLQSGIHISGGVIKFARRKGGKVVTSVENGVAEISAVYPNPANDLINRPADLKVSQGYITDALGRRVITVNSETSIDVSRLSPGVYYLVVEAKRYRFIKK